MHTDVPHSPTVMFAPASSPQCQLSSRPIGARPRVVPDAEFVRLHEAWPVLAKDLLGSALDCLSFIHEVCGGDIELFLIMLAVGLRSAEHRDYPKLTYEYLADRHSAPPPSLMTNVKSLAESLGIPKETVRRKVDRLVAAGWLIKEGALLRLPCSSSPPIPMLRDAVLTAAYRQHVAVRRVLV